MRYSTCTFTQMKYINMFSMFLQSGVPKHRQKHGYLGCFHAASARENISGICVIDNSSTFIDWAPYKQYNQLAINRTIVEPYLLFQASIKENNVTLFQNIH